jgi:hypothetical protein
VQNHLAFTVRRSELKDGVLIPKYYDPELAEAAELAYADFQLHRIGDLLEQGSAGSKLGVWIRREHYGSGSIPYVRTSDIVAWRIRPDFKKGISAGVLAKYGDKQDVQAGDLLMVAHGTYLVGTVGIVTKQDLPLLLQDHVFRLRPKQTDGIGSELLLAALSTRFVRQQVRSRQFSADIIDKLGERHLGILVPLPKAADRCNVVSATVRIILDEQSSIQAEIAALLGSDLRMTRERATTRHGFTITRSQVARRILIPKYYDPILNREMQSEEDRGGETWITIGSLITQGLVKANTGVEVGKMVYGTGNIPFVRTTDIAGLELKADPRQGISESVYKRYEGKASLAEGDVILIRDGTYLVGSSAIVTEDDVPALFCGGIYRFRSLDLNLLDPFALLVALNLPIVRRQMRARQFTRDVIDTLGRRLLEVRIPDPTSSRSRDLGSRLRALMQRKAALKREIAKAVRFCEPSLPPQLRTRPGWSMRG